MRVQKYHYFNKARTLVRGIRSEEKKFIRDRPGSDWMDARNYHLCMDSSTVVLPLVLR